MRLTAFVQSALPGVVGAASELFGRVCEPCGDIEAVSYRGEQQLVCALRIWKGFKRMGAAHERQSDASEWHCILYHNAESVIIDFATNILDHGAGLVRFAISFRILPVPPFHVKKCD